MKKLLLFTAVTAVLGFSSINAQSIKLGAKAGVNIANTGGEDFVDGFGDKFDRGALISFHLGAVAEIEFSDKLALQPELLYSSQGSIETFGEDGFEEEYKFKRTYLNVPIMVKYYLIEGLSLEVGPQVGILLSSELDYEYNDSLFPEDNESETVDFKEFTSGVDFGFNIGAGYKLESGLNFSARYNLGLSNINDFEGSDDFSQTNNVIQFSVGYMF